jgi:uroporphyrinogen-III synthase
VEHLFQVAGTKQAASLQAGFERIVVASIGPFCSDALRRHGIKVDLEPEHPKMGHLISTLAERGPALVQTKRRTQQRK